MPDLTADDVLSHYGVAGMKWGKRKASSDSGDSDGGSAPKAKTKPTNDDIKTARGNQQKRVRELQEAEAEYYTSRTNKGMEKAERIMRNKEYDLFNNPDAAVAAKMTRGEKALSGTLYAVSAAIFVGSIVQGSRH